MTPVGSSDADYDMGWSDFLADTTGLMFVDEEQVHQQSRGEHKQSHQQSRREPKQSHQQSQAEPRQTLQMQQDMAPQSPSTSTAEPQHHTSQQLMYRGYVGNAEGMWLDSDTGCQAKGFGDSTNTVADKAGAGKVANAAGSRTVNVNGGRV